MVINDTSLGSTCLKFCRPLELGKGISLDLNFVARQRKSKRLSIIEKTKVLFFEQMYFSKNN